MTTPPLMVAFYQDTPLTRGEYFRHARRLRSQARAVAQPLLVERRNFGDNYLAITRGKPRFMLEKLDQHGTIVYVDVDSQIRAVWDYPPSDRIGWARRTGGRPHDYVHYLPDNQATRDFLHVWLEILDSGWEGGDHTALWLAIKRTRLQWDALEDIQSRVDFVISDNESTRQAAEHLEAIGWRRTVRRRLGR